MPNGTQPRKQCAHCPWKKSTDPNDIPNGYSRKKHQALASTIAEPSSLAGVNGGLRIMACHETISGAEQPCVGWLANQLGPGNNLALRLRVIMGQVNGNVETDGPQHATFEATLRRRAKKTSGASPG